MIKSKSGVSEVIVVTLLIVTTVIIAGTAFTFVRESSNEKLNQLGSELTQASELSCNDAEFIVNSCDIYDVDNVTDIIFTNNSDLDVFNLMLTIEGKDVNGEDLTLIGRFENIVEGGQIAGLSTDTNFTYTRGEADYNTLNVDQIDSVVLTNGACPKKSLVLDCTIHSDLDYSPNPLVVTLSTPSRNTVYAIGTSISFSSSVS